MLKNYLKIALRSFIRNPLYTALNVLGLAIGITFSLLLFLGIKDHLSIDRFHAEGDQIYRSYFNGVNDEGQVTFTQPSCPYPLYTTLLETRGVENAVYFDDGGEFMVGYNGQLFKEETVWATPSLFEVFSFPLLEGSVENGRTNNQSMFISRASAERIFGENWEGNAVGQTVRLNQDFDCMIAGVFENIGENSTVRFEVVLNADALPAYRNEHFLTHWGGKDATVYAKLEKEVDPRTIENQINPIYKKAPGYGVGGEAVMLFPFEDNFLWTQFENGIAVGGQIQYVKIFFGASLFLLLIACINFINLSTAQASKKAKEVGVRKTVGAGKSNLVFQFLTETGMMILLTLLLSIGFASHFIPSLNDLTSKGMYIPYDQPLFWASIGGFAIILTLLAGLYPAFVLSNFKPINALRSKVTTKNAHGNIRKGLVIFQFVLSAILIISTIVVNSHVHFIKNNNFGLARNNIIHLRLPNPLLEKYELLQDKLEANSVITEVIKVSNLPTKIGSIGVGYTWEGYDPENAGYFYQLYTDFGFDEVFEIEMVAGRFFDKNTKSDINGVVINEKALDYIKMENPVGKIINDDGELMTILGIAKNFPFTGLRKEVEPLMIQIRPQWARQVVIKSKPEETAQTIALLEQTWAEISPDYPLEYHFLDETYGEMFKLETIIGQISSFMAFIAILISCLGLFGLVTFMAAQKAKEIGIRKVLGASVLNIIGLLSKDFIKLILAGLLIAIPLAWYGVNQWLNSYAYRVELKWWMFASAVVVAVTIALITISFQSIRAALANPIKALKDE